MPYIDGAPGSDMVVALIMMMTIRCNDNDE
jgi:hypothetical protein